MGTFKRCVDFTIDCEVGNFPNGGYTFNPKDPGGETKWGISKRFHPDLDIKNLTREQAVEIYKLEYWNPSASELLDEALALCNFDTAVLCGLGIAKKILKNSNKKLDLYLEQRKQYHYDRIKKNPTLKSFEDGWMNRISKIYNTIIDEGL